MFSESVSPPSWKPVTSCRNDLIAVCWAHTNQGIDMCTLSLYSGNRQSLQSCNAFSPPLQLSNFTILFAVAIEMPQTSPPPAPRTRS